VIGGAGGPDFTSGYRSVLTYDPGDGTWAEGQALTLGRSAAAVAELSDQRVLVAGGVAVSAPAAPDPDAALMAATGEVLIP
jgi:hypothetical protein